MFTKDRKGRIRGVKLFKEIPHINNHKLITVQCGRVTETQIEAARRVISKQVKKKAKYKLHIHPSISVSSKPSEVRMGKGKGSIDHYISRVRAGQIIFSVEGTVPTIAIRNMFLKASRKLPVKIKIIYATNQLKIV
jgi:large subunit ribosomal protein L16